MAEEQKQSTKPKSNILPSTKGIGDENKDDFLKWRKEVYTGKASNVSKIEELLIKSHKLDNVREKMIRDLYEMKKQEKSDRGDKYEKIIIADFGEEALKKLKTRESETTIDGDKGEEKPSGFLEKLLIAAVPLLMAGGAFITSFQEMMKGGPLQGIMNIMGKGFALIFDSFAKMLPRIPAISKLMGKLTTFSIGKGLGMAFTKRLPIIGSLISLGSAFKRIQDGDILGGLIDVGAAIAYMFPGVGTAIGIALDVLNATMDVAEAKQGQTGFIATAKQMFNEWFDKNKRNIPVIGTFIRLSEAFGLLYDGDVKGFLKGVMGAGFTNIGLGAAYDFLFGSTDENASDIDKQPLKGMGIKEAMVYVRDLIWGKIKQMFNNIRDGIKTMAGSAHKYVVALGAKLGFWDDPEFEANLAEDDANLERMSTEILTTGQLNGKVVNDVQRRQALRVANENIADTQTQIDNMREGLNRGRRGLKGEERQEQIDRIRELERRLEELQKMTNNTTNVGVSNNNSNISTTHNHPSYGISRQRDTSRHSFKSGTAMVTVGV